jgi:nicotinamide-nucleotide adenylyltransferase
MGDGLVVMRAQPLHFGHIRLIDSALKKCGRVFVVLGSAQEEGTERNPFSFSERKSMLFRYYRQEDPASWECIQVLGLKDIFSLRWPSYVLEEIMKEYSDANITDIFGGSSYDTDWFKDHGLTPNIVDRTADDYPFISASMLRDMLTYKDPKWTAYVPKCNWSIIAKKFDCEIPDFIPHAYPQQEYCPDCMRYGHGCSCM